MYSKIKPYIEICRVSNLPTVWTNVLAATVLTGPGYHWWAVFPIVLAMTLFYSGGMCLNDILDAEVDRTSRPERPIPSGRIQPWQAWIWTITLFTAALLLLLAVPFQRALVAGVLLLGLIVWYDVYHKAYAYSIMVMAGCRFMVFMATALALSGKVGLPVLSTALIQFGYIVCISAVARYENSRKAPLNYSVIPLMIAGISIIDGLAMALWSTFWWLIPGVGATMLTLAGQRFVRGD